MLGKEHGFNFHNFYILSWYQSHLKDTRLELWLILIPSSASASSVASRAILHQGPTKDGLYPLLPSTSSSSIKQAFVGERTSTASWHKRLGHPAFRTVQHVLSQFNLPVSSNKASSPCSACAQAKGHQQPFSSSSASICSHLQLIYSDVWGASPTLSINGSRFYVSFIDAFSRFTWVFPLQAESDVMSVFLKFQVIVERLLNTKIISV